MIATSFRYVKSQLAVNLVARGAGFALVVRIYGAAMAFLTQLFLARVMGPSELGIFVFAWTWLSIAAVLTPAGFDTAVVRFLAEYAGKREWDQARGVVSLARRTTVGASFAVAGIGLAAVLLGGAGGAVYRHALVVALVCIPALALVCLYEGIARGLGRVFQVTAPTFALRPTLFLGLLLLIVAVGWPLSGTLAVAAMGMACVLTLAWQIWRYRRTCGAQMRQPATVRRTRFWLSSALPMVLVVSFEQSLANTDIVMLGILSGAEATGIYNVAVRIVGISLFVFFAVSAFAAPRIAALHSQGSRLELVTFCHKVRLAIAVPTLLALLCLVLIGHPLLAIFGDEFVAAYMPLLVLSVAVGVRALAGPVDNLLTMTGRQKDLAWILGTVAMLNFLANALLIPIYGTIGAACATTGSVVLEIVWVSILASRHTGYRPWILGL